MASILMKYIQEYVDMKESSTKFPHELLIDEFQQRIYERSSYSYSVPYTQHCGFEDM